MPAPPSRRLRQISFADHRRARDDEERRRPRIAERGERPRPRRLAAAQHEQRGDRDAREQHDGESRVAHELRQRAREDEHAAPRRPARQSPRRACGSADARGRRRARTCRRAPSRSRRAGPAMIIALTLAAMLTMVKSASRLPAANPNSRSATVSIKRPPGSAASSPTGIAKTYSAFSAT